MPQYDRVASTEDEAAAAEEEITKVPAEIRAEMDWKKDDGLVKKSVMGNIVDMVDGHIDGYDLEAILRGGFFRVKAPVFSQPFVAIQTLYVLFCVVCVAVVFVILHTTHVMLVDGSVVVKAYDIFQYFGAFSSFLFGFYIFDALGTLNMVKGSGVGKFWANFSLLILHTSAWFPGTDEQTKLFKCTIVRWCLATFALTCGEAGGDLENVTRCEERGLLTAEEATLVRKHGSRAVTPLVWMVDAYQTNLFATEGAGGHPEFKVLKMEAYVLGMRSGVGVICNATSAWGQTPLPLVHLMSGLVKLQLCLLAITEGVSAANIYVGDSTSKGLQILVVLIMVICPPVIFQGLLEFVVMIGNPFGRDWVDFPTAIWKSQMRKETFEYISIGETSANLPSVSAINRW